MDSLFRSPPRPSDEDPASVGASGQRGRGRDSLFLVAQVTMPGERNEQTVRVRNLSAGGLMIETDRAMAVGAVLILGLRGIGEVTGRVAWCAEGRVGIALDSPIDPKRARKPVGGRQVAGPGPRG